MRVMLPTTDLVAPPAPAGYGFQGLILLGSKPNGRGIRTSFAVYTKSGARSGAKCDGSRALGFLVSAIAELVTAGLP